MWDALVTWIKKVFGGDGTKQTRKDHQRATGSVPSDSPPRSAAPNPDTDKPPTTAFVEDLAEQAARKHRREELTHMQAASERNRRAEQARLHFQVLLNILDEQVKQYNQSLSMQGHSSLAIALTKHSQDFFEIRGNSRSVQFHLAGRTLEICLERKPEEIFTLEQGSWTKTEFVDFARPEFQPSERVEKKRTFENQKIAQAYLQYLAGVRNRF